MLSGGGGGYGGVELSSGFGGVDAPAFKNECPGLHPIHDHKSTYSEVDYNCEGEGGFGAIGTIDEYGYDICGGASGGGGLETDGQPGMYGSGGKSYLNGGNGGSVSDSTAYGGFGGGGSAHRSG